MTTATTVRSFYAFKYYDGINTTTDDHRGNTYAYGQLLKFRSQKERKDYVNDKDNVHSVTTRDLPLGWKVADAMYLEDTVS